MRSNHNQAESRCRYVIAHGGARDSYQVALALHEAGLLDALVTDLFCSAETARRWEGRLPAALRSLLLARTAPLPAGCVRVCAGSGLLATLLERSRRVPFTWRRLARRYSDWRLGTTAGRLARRNQAGLLAYSYFGAPAFRSYGKAAMLFQVHPHPLTTRRLLQEELEAHPECAESLQQEWELALPPRDLQLLVAESQEARSYVVASSFTRRSLVEHGVPPERIEVVPYGVDLQRFHPAPQRERSDTLRLLFVGRINQRKGMLYLLEALEQLAGVPVHLTVCGRVVDDLKLFDRVRDRVTIRPSVSEAELVAAYQQADLFVFPSVVEGFGQVLLESLACGLPILATTHTAAPDLIEEGRQGWVVEPRNVQQLAERIRWAAAHRDELEKMHAAARQRAEQFTWQRFREGIVHFVNAEARHARSTASEPTVQELVSA